MKDLKDITHEDFEACMSDVFTVKIEGDEGPELELIEVKTFGEADPNANTRQPFSLLFRGPMEPVLPQRLYDLEHSEQGETMLFLVPIGPDDKGMLYDVTIN